MISLPNRCTINALHGDNYFSSGSPSMHCYCLPWERSFESLHVSGPGRKSRNREKEAVMKKLLLQGLACVCFFTAAAAVVSRAQTVGLRVDIPFSFNVDEKV